jgi:hypothetical protein
MYRTMTNDELLTAARDGDGTASMYLFNRISDGKLTAAADSDLFAITEMVGDE